MINIIDLKTGIYQKLATVATTYEADRVEKGATFPFVTYRLTQSVEGDTDSLEQVNFILEVNILDHNKDKSTDRIEALVNSVDTVMAYVQTLVTDYYIFFTREGINPSLPTQDEFTFRRELRYNVKTYKR